MPYLKVRTNQPVSPETNIHISKILSKNIAKLLAKPESYVMIDVESNPSLLFAETSEPAAYMELKSIGLPDIQIPVLSRSLCSTIRENLNIDPSRIYIEFTDVKAKHWGWNGGTF
jgi:phenylpyruvate tautomerase